MRRLWMCALIGVGAAALPALAQDSGLKPTKKGDDLEDLGGWLDEDEKAPPPPALPKKPAAPAPAPAPAPEPDNDPLAPPPAKPAAPAAPAAPAEDPYEAKIREKRRGKQIDRNYNDAQRTYREILKADPVKPLSRRISSNERIVREYRARIRRAAKERRQLEVELFNRSFYLEQQLKKKQITQSAYERLILQEEQKYQTRSKSLKRNMKAWATEVREAQMRLKNMTSERRMLEAQRPKKRRVRRGSRRGGVTGAKARPGQRLLSTLRQRLKRLGRFETRNTLDSVHPRDMGVSMRPPIGNKKTGDDAKMDDDAIAESDEPEKALLEEE